MGGIRGNQAGTLKILESSSFSVEARVVNFDFRRSHRTQLSELSADTVFAGLKFSYI